MGKISKGAKCSVEGCGQDAVKSFSAEKVRSVGLAVSSGTRRAYLCRMHTKEYKKKTRKERKVEKWRHTI
ncbi:MAG: hypothetical protein ACETVV_00700 [Nitrososphaeria archaeon]